MEVVWEKGGPGIVWYTDAQFWKVITMFTYYFHYKYLINFLNQNILHFRKLREILMSKLQMTGMLITLFILKKMVVIRYADQLIFEFIYIRTL